MTIKNEDRQTILGIINNTVRESLKDQPEIVKKTIFACVQDQDKVVNETRLSIQFPELSGFTQQHREQIHQATQQALRAAIGTVFQQIMQDRINQVFDEIRDQLLNVKGPMQ